MFKSRSGVEMVVYEVGIIQSGGLPVLTRSYNKDGVNADTFLISGFLSAIQTVMDDLFSDTGEELKMKKFSIFLRALSWGKNSCETIVYVISSRRVNSTVIKKALARLIAKLAQYNYLYEDTQVTHSEKYNELVPIIDEEFEKMSQTVTDRMQEILG